jgi:hypothetical protein
MTLFAIYNRHSSKTIFCCNNNESDALNLYHKTNFFWTQNLGLKLFTLTVKDDCFDNVYTFAII